MLWKSQETQGHSGTKARRQIASGRMIYKYTGTESWHAEAHGII